MSQLAESLKKCRIEGNTLFLPPISEGPLTNYQDVRKALLNAGASYKRNTFVFPTEAQPIIDKLCGGTVVNLKKEFQFFATPPDIADFLVELANIEPGMNVLEPSAGHGAIIDAIYRAHPHYMKSQQDEPCVTVDWYELMDINTNVLLAKNNEAVGYKSRTSCMGKDFLKEKVTHTYPRIVANPPFNKNQDIDHIKKMYECLKTGGRMVTITSKHWQFAQNKKETAFRDWLAGKDHVIHEIEPGRFKSSGTMIGCLILVIDK